MNVCTEPQLRNVFAKCLPEIILFELVPISVGVFGYSKNISIWQMEYILFKLKGLRVE